MVEWIGYGSIAGDVSGPQTFFADLTIEVPRGDVVAAAAVTGSSVGVFQQQPGSVAAYIREYGRFKSSTMIEVVDVPPDPMNNVLAIADCAFVRFRMTVFQARAFAQGLVFRFARPPVQIGPATKFTLSKFRLHARGRDVGTHSVMTLTRGSTLRIDPIFKRVAAEAGQFLGLRPRDIEFVRARRRTRPKLAPNVF